MAITKWNVWYKSGSLRIKKLVRKIRYTLVQSSKAKKKLHNHVKHVCPVDFKVSPGLGAEQRFGLLTTAELGCETNLEERETEYWLTPAWGGGEGGSKFLVQISALDQQVSHSQTLSPLSLCFFTTPYLNARQIIHMAWLGYGKQESWKHAAPGRMRPTLTGGFCERPACCH